MILAPLRIFTSLNNLVLQSIAAQSIYIGCGVLKFHLQDSIHSLYFAPHIKKKKRPGSTTSQLFTKRLIISSVSLSWLGLGYMGKFHVTLFSPSTVVCFHVCTSLPRMVRAGKGVFGCASFESRPISCKVHLAARSFQTSFVLRPQSSDSVYADEDHLPLLICVSRPRDRN